jgi:hypothetical protein
VELISKINMEILLQITKRTDDRLLSLMENHYSQPKGFVGRSICYAISYDDIYYGHIVGGSATRFLPGRNEFLGINLDSLNSVVNNIFYSIHKVDNNYPLRNFTSKVLSTFESTVVKDWYVKYEDVVIGFETLVEKPRTGELYKKAGWVVVGETIGYTCKRVAGEGSDSWSGKRVWNTDKESLRPKIVLCKKYKGEI